MIVLKIILWLLAAVLIILCIPVFIRVNYDNSASIRVRILFVPFDVYPQEKFENNKLVSFFKKLEAKFPKKKKPKTKVDAQEKKTEKTSPFAELISQQGFSGAIGLLLETARLAAGSFGKILKTTVVDRFNIDVRIADEDAASTAISYGRWCAVIYPAVSLILRCVLRYKKNLVIRPDYNAEESVFKAEVRVHLYPVAVLCIAAALIVKLLWRQIKKTVKEKVEENLKAAGNAK